jgi:hypothetical protein
MNPGQQNLTYENSCLMGWTDSHAVLEANSRQGLCLDAGFRSGANCTYRANLSSGGLSPNIEWGPKCEGGLNEVLLINKPL